MSDSLSAEVTMHLEENNKENKSCEATGDNVTS
jgi:hypothetical protein